MLISRCCLVIVLRFITLVVLATVVTASASADSGPVDVQVADHVSEQQSIPSTPQQAGQDSHSRDDDVQGQASSAEKPRSSIVPPQRMLNIGFVRDPGVGNYDGVVGNPNDIWNFVSLGTTAKDYMLFSDGGGSTARLRVSKHDGAWGIAGHTGVFHGYIYDNCRCKDLKVTILDLQPGRYRGIVYAHGDAPNQNANIELRVAGESYGKKATANDGTFGYRSAKMAEGVQYVSFEFNVGGGDKVKIISHRDGSDYSMFNAIQLVPIDATSAEQSVTLR